jgi:dihydrofolate reductase
MNYKLIVASCKNNGIGINNQLPWHLSSDLKRFSKLTRGKGNNAIIMGRKTWESLPNNFLPKRDNLILSKTIQIDKIEKNQLIKTFHTMIALNNFCIKQKYDEVWIIGGEQIYNTFLNHNLIHEIYMTYIDEEVNCDAFFKLELDKYEEIESKLCLETIKLNGEDVNKEIDIEYKIFGRLVTHNKLE